MPRRLISRPWTDDEEALLLALHREGRSMPVMAARLRRRESAIRRRRAEILRRKAGDTRLPPAGQRPA